MSTLVEELERAANELHCGCSAPKLCDRDRVAARLRQRAAWVRELLEAVDALDRAGQVAPGERYTLAALTGPDIPAATPSPETGTAAVPMTEKPPHKWFPEPGVGWKCGHCFALRRVHGCGENEPGMDYRLRGGRTWLEYEPDCIGTFAAGPAPEPVKPPATKCKPWCGEKMQGARSFCSDACFEAHVGTARTPAAGTAPKGEK